MLSRLLLSAPISQRFGVYRRLDHDETSPSMPEDYPMYNETLYNETLYTDPYYTEDGYDDTYYYEDDYYYEYIDYELAYMFAPEDWGWSEWQDGYFCDGMTEDPEAMAIASQFPDEFWDGFVTREECFDWCKDTKKEMG